MADNLNMEIVKLQEKIIKLESQIKLDELIGKLTILPKKEVHAHGFFWEKELLLNVYHATPDELKQIKYNSKIDLPSKMNHLDNCNISIKTSGKLNSVCMADCLRVFDSVNNETPIHVVVINYIQNITTKSILSIIEIDLTNSSELLFGTLTRGQIKELDDMVKGVPQKKKPTESEYSLMYDIKNKLQKLSGAIHLDIKCNSTQSRLQCSFNYFQDFIKKNPTRVISKSDTNEFRGGIISTEIISSRRVLKK